MTIYSKNDYMLRDHLTQLKYLCDDTSAGRGISSVIKENDTIKKQLQTAKNEIDSLVSLVHELQRPLEDASLEDIIEEISNASGCTGGGNFNVMPMNMPKLDLNPVLKNAKDKTNYKQLCTDQHNYINELDKTNNELKNKNKRLIDYIKSKTLKYKFNAKDSMKRLLAVKQKLSEYDGLN